MKANQSELALSVPHHNRMQRCVRDKVLGRGRGAVLLNQVHLARVLRCQRAGADVGR
jgi:hypothetical protein